MKTLLTAILFLHATSFTVYSQWISQNSGTNQNLYDIEFINEKTGWAVGGGGIVIKTTNSGTNWINIPNPAIGKPLLSIHLIDSNNIYIVGWFETIIKSTDGGNSWIVIRNGPLGEGSSYEGLFFINKDTGWICGTGLYILKTTNSGSSFDSSYLFWGELSDMYFKDYNTGIICADGAVFKTTNSGLNWYNTNVPTNGVYYMFKKLAVVNNNVWVAGSSNPPVYKSSDFCQNWVITDTIRNSTIAGITFINNQTGFAGGGLNKLFKTTNGGNNWLRENTGSGVTAGIISIEFANELTGWYVSGAGKIFHTTTGGQTLVNISNQNYPEAIEFILYQNYPNPFNPATKITFSIKFDSYISLKVFDNTGRLIKSIVNNKFFKRGEYINDFNAEGLQSGVYYYSLSSKNGSLTKKMLLLR